MATNQEKRVALRAQRDLIEQGSNDKALLRSVTRKLYDLRDEQDVEKGLKFAAQELKDFATTPALFGEAEARESVALLVSGLAPMNLSDPLPEDPEELAAEEARRTLFKRARNALTGLVDPPLSTASPEFLEWIHERRESKLGLNPKPGSPTIAKEAEEPAALAALTAGEMTATALKDALAKL